MDHSLENRIRERAYEIWTAHGYVHGQADQHWLAAEREILAASTIVLVREPAPQKKRRFEIRRRKHRRPVGRVTNHFCSRGGRLRLDRAK